MFLMQNMVFARKSVWYVVFLLLHSCEIMEFKEMGLAVFCLLPGRKWFIPSLRRCLLQYALSTKRCMLGNQDRYLARVVLFLLCSPILSPLQVISRKVFDEFTQLNKVRNFCRIFSTHLGTCS